MEEIQLGVGDPFPVQISIRGPGDFAPSTGGAPNSTPDAPSEDGGDGRSHAMKWLIGVFAQMTVAGASTFQAASALPKPFLVTYVAISLLLAVLDLALLVLLLCSSGGQSLTRFAKRGAMVMMVLVLLLALIPKAYTAL